jgi:hypothetical protein
MPDASAPDAEAERTIAKVRRLMLIVGAATFLALAAVVAVIGYRVSRLGESADTAPAFADVSAALPAGAKVISTELDDEHIMVTIEVNGETEILTFDPDTLKPLGRLRLTSKP